jgi:hypothetical protein
VFEPLDLDELPRSSYTLPLSHLSPAQVLAYLTCPACYEAQYVHHQPRKVNIALPLGSGVHAGIAYARKQAQLDDGVWALGDILDAGLDRFALGILGQDPLDPDPPDAVDPDWTVPDVDKAQNHVREILTAHSLPLVQRDIQAGIVEVEALVDFDDVFPFAFKAYLDLRVPQGIVELKTAAKKGTPDRNAAWQVACYALPEYHRAGALLGLGIDKIVKNQTSDHVYYAVTTGPAEMENVERDVLLVADAISAGSFPQGPGRFGQHDYDHQRPVAYFIGGDE